VLESVASKWWTGACCPRAGFLRQAPGPLRLPLLIAENGWRCGVCRTTVPSGPDNLARSQYLREHVRVVNGWWSGQPLIGYLHWSLFDNYEWGSFAPRFGLFSLDYTVYPHASCGDATGDNPSATTRRKSARPGCSLRRRPGARKKAGAGAGCPASGATSATTLQ